MKFKQFMRLQGFGASIFMGIFYAVAMLLIFLLGYTALPGNMDELKVALVNDDKGGTGTQIAEQLAESLPFEITTNISNEKALDQLGDNKYALVIHIPEKFSESAQNGQSAQIDFTVNEASATMVSSSMSSVVAEINDCWRAVLFLLLTVPIIYLYNATFNTNFMFLNKPVKNTPLQWLYDAFGASGYLVSLAGVIFIIWVMLYTLKAMKKSSYA